MRRAFILTFLCVSSLFVVNKGNAETINALEEVIVTAQRKEQNNQNIAVAVTVLSDKDLNRGDITNIVDAGPIVSGLVATTYNSTNPQFFIRGIGSTGTSAGEDSSVSVVTDEVSLGRSGTGSLDFLDLERVEVLRGAQGTLFGRNSVGGVIQMVSKKPTAETEGYISAELGRYSKRSLKAALGGALKVAGNDMMLSRASASYSRRDGYVTNTTTGSTNLRESEDFSSRLHILQEWSDNASALLTIDYANSNQLGPSARKASTSQAPLFAGGFIPLAQPVDDIYTTSLAVDGPIDRRTLGMSLKINIDMPTTEFVSISGFRNNRYELLEDVSGVGLVLLGQDEDSKYFSQEFRLNTKSRSRLQWTVGAYYLIENVDRNDQTDLTGISDFINLNPDVTIPDEEAFYQQEAENQSYAAFSRRRLGLAVPSH